MSATARVAAPHTPRTRAGARASLTVAPEARAAVAGNGIFALVVVGLLLAGMVMLLVLNTSLAQGSFEIGSLTKTQDALAVSEQQLLQQVARAEAPESLQARATELGMVPVSSPVFLRLADGAVLGTPTPAVRLARPAGTNSPAAPAAVTTTTPTKTATTPQPATAKPATAKAATAKAATAKTAATTASSDGAVADPGTKR